LSVDQHDEQHQPPEVSVWLSVQGKGSISDLTAALTEINGVLTVSGSDANTPEP
jgi:putative Mg2+ transporter-C (MgtC) family protein